MPARRLSLLIPCPALRKQKFSLWLNFFRWASAFAVLLNHVGGIVLVPVSTITAGQRSIGAYAFALVSGWGALAVMVFFVLSGFLVGGQYYEQLVEGRGDIRVYFVKRLVRLGIVLLPCLVLSAVAGLGFHMAPTSPLKWIVAMGAVVFSVGIAFALSLVMEVKIVRKWLIGEIRHVGNPIGHTMKVFQP